MRCYKILLYIILRIQQLCCCACCCCRGRRRGDRFVEGGEDQQTTVDGFETSGESTVDSEHVAAQLGVPPPVAPDLEGGGKFDLDYHKDLDSDAIAKKVVRVPAVPLRQIRANLIFQITYREDWFNDELIRGTMIMHVIASAFGPLSIEGLPRVDTGRVIYTVIANTDDVIQKWSEQTNWASVSKIMDGKMRLAEVTRIFPK
jgi:hypothetical protein